MRRAAIYARFSTDLQNDRSIEDQVESCRALAAREGLAVGAVYSDRAQSGSSMHGRAGVKAMLSAAAERAFDVLICESMSRVGRDQEDRASVRKNLAFADIRVLTVADGFVTNLTDGIRAVIDSQYTEDLKVAIRRGMSGNIGEGKHNGGPPYGYRPVKGEIGHLEIVEHEADVIRRIYARFLAGDDPRTIAGALNCDGVKPPRGTYWRASTIHGDQQRAFGILRNEIYLGRLIWNKTRKVYHPKTGNRLTRHNPPELWQRADAPHLRIISDELFETAAAMRKCREVSPTRGRTKKNGRMLSGLLRCGCCGAGMSLKDYDHGKPRIICSRMNQSGSCDNRRAYYLEPIERSVAAGLREQFGTREALAHFVACYNDECRRIASGSTDALERSRRALASIEQEIERTVAAVVKNVITEREAGKHLPELRCKRDALMAEIAGASGGATVTVLHRPAIDEFLASLDRIDAAINLGLHEGNREVAEAMRGLVETVTIERAKTPDPPNIIVRGYLASPCRRGDATIQTPGTNFPTHHRRQGDKRQSRIAMRLQS